MRVLAPFKLTYNFFKLESYGQAVEILLLISLASTQGLNPTVLPKQSLLKLTKYGHRGRPRLEFNLPDSYTFMFKEQSNAFAISAKIPCPIHRGYYMSAHALLNLLDELRKRDKMRGLSSILSLFCNM